MSQVLCEKIYESGDLIEEEEKVRTDSFQNWRNYEILVSSFAIVNIRKELHEPKESRGDVSGTQCMNSTLFQKINPTLQLCLPEQIPVQGRKLSSCESHYEAF
jgi:hypothetical protein